MRRSPDSTPSDGEWLCRIAEIGKSGVRLTVERQLRAPEPEPDLWLLFAPIKRARLDWLVEKATELGVSALLPVWTARTQSERLNLERLRAHAVEAAEQSERLSVPELRPPERARPRARRLACRAASRRLRRERCRRADRRRRDAAPGRAGWRFSIGPEGGFDQTELDALGKLSFVTRIGLGPRVLRAETAALAALAVFQAIAGDWRRTRSPLIVLAAIFGSSAEDDHRPELARSADHRQAAARRISRIRLQAARGVAGRHRAREIRLSPLGSAPGAL